MTSPVISRRLLLAAGASITFLGGGAYADETLNRRKLVVVICRGGMDGLSVSPPIGDPDYANLRGSIAIPASAALKLDDTFALHPSLTTVHRLALAGQARIAPAIASPDRARSHFEAQDVLESGASKVYGVSSGFLNRTLASLAPQRKVAGLSVGATAPLILRGKAPAGSWSPGAEANDLPRLPGLLTDLYAGDPMLAAALAQGLQTEAMAASAEQGQMAGGGMTPGLGRAALASSRKLGTTLAGFMTQPNGPQIAAISLDGFDTHANQNNALPPRLAGMDALLDGLSSGLGDEWKNTVVVCATEFGRTAKVNGTGGTDHGTGSTALVLGGALKKGGIIGDWPTLKQQALFENRDTAPTLDMRGLFKGVLADHMGVDRRALEGDVFPDSAGAAPVVGLV
ncbi:uncharacterized protein (DUF1501 family) [Caulobacter ginsengisoli]|uniref:Uncharacterized protein (DUF1501 family) n=1 Tax=Caulobacter ginsengisoli TaxID=400775 RepID=A0ABU0IL99_9CAUL|nr:DUF1501 domain-containing protein [Caulobacter ginsengisoli]MDQ0462790.1 uncharacterized protein (DUF1501 family) [Caulobacter ginsengisoli]